MELSLHHPNFPSLPILSLAGKGGSSPQPTAVGRRGALSVPGGSACAQHLPAAARPARGPVPASSRPAAEAWAGLSLGFAVAARRRRRQAQLGGGVAEGGTWEEPGSRSRRSGSGSSPEAATCAEGNLRRGFSLVPASVSSCVNTGIGDHGQGCCKGSNEIRGVKHYKLLSAVVPGPTAITTRPHALPRILCQRPAGHGSRPAPGLKPAWGHS